MRNLVIQRICNEFHSGCPFALPLSANDAGWEAYKEDVPWFQTVHDLVAETKTSVQGGTNENISGWKDQDGNIVKWGDATTLKIMLEQCKNNFLLDLLYSFNDSDQWDAFFN